MHPQSCKMQRERERERERERDERERESERERERESNKQKQKGSSLLYPLAACMRFNVQRLDRLATEYTYAMLNYILD